MLKCLDCHERVLVFPRWQFGNEIDDDVFDVFYDFRFDCSQLLWLRRWRFFARFSRVTLAPDLFVIAARYSNGGRDFFGY